MKYTSTCPVDKEKDEHKLRHKSKLQKKKKISSIKCRCDVVFFWIHNRFASN